MEFDPTSTLMRQDVKLGQCKAEGTTTAVLKIHLKSPKEQRLKEGITVELFATNSFLCPVTAFNNYVRDCPFNLADDKPVFRTMDGKGYTGKMFNADLKVLLHGHVDYKDGKITSHSFRAGLATASGVTI